ncbi:uncharacterized protein LOC107489061 isoform X1 [Arachis duranensis]|uniref:Uncharacterized protein LOC107489061 isoform X1 n=1 Tax=Arachis duranensis TaxID=130453 RepID=A0A9C6TV17_ARADU|nr:uncharacterized protein LOC107489061 isoform X1 [Arachis duranensis]
MNSANSPLVLPFLFFLVTSFFHDSLFRASAQKTDWINKENQNGNEFGERRGRVLMSFKEKPSGSNVTFECTPSGPCVPCLYSEKLFWGLQGDEKYRCGETGYRIPFKCLEIKDTIKGKEKINPREGRSLFEFSNNIETSDELSHVSGEFTTTQSQRHLLDDSSASDNKSHAYITYRSCIPPASGEKLSVLNFEAIMLFLLAISGSFIYLRKKKAVSVSGYTAVRSQTNSRF